MVVPQELMPKAREMQSRLYRRVNTQVQMALDRLLGQGIYVKHVAAMRKRYKKKIQSMINALNEEFGDIIQIYGANSGLHVAVVFRCHCSAKTAGKFSGNIKYPWIYWRITR